jgi:hypothetical protein
MNKHHYIEKTDQIKAEIHICPNILPSIMYLFYLQSANNVISKNTFVAFFLRRPVMQTALNNNSTFLDWHFQMNRSFVFRIGQWGMPTVSFMGFHHHRFNDRVCR